VSAPTSSLAGLPDLREQCPPLELLENAKSDLGTLVFTFEKWQRMFLTRIHGLHHDIRELTNILEDSTPSSVTSNPLFAPTEPWNTPPAT
jgi:hypothetical protein